MKAYAKVNLLLHVINKRDDGYHNLQMVNCKIDLFDDIYIRRNNLGVDVVKATNIDNYISDDNNLILKVVKAFKIRYNIERSYDIEIEKNIPFGSGLGGVSMDVGEILKFLIIDNELNISKDELIQFTKPFGADIPYSFTNKPAIVEGVGDIITEVELSARQFILVLPNIEVSTPVIFKNNQKYTEKLSHKDLLNKVIQGNRNNDLTNSTRYIYKELDNLIIELERFGKIVMSGSGSGLTIEPYENRDKVLNDLKNIYNNFIILKINTKEG